MRQKCFLIISLVSVCLATATAWQQEPPPPKTAAISGTVIDGATGSPVSGAVVYIYGPPPGVLGSQTRQLTDNRGRFAFVGLPSDTQYFVQASKFGYMDGGYGRDTEPTDPLRPVTLKADDWAANLKVTIWKPNAIGGVVRDESGEPVVGIIVRALMKVRIQGRDDFAAGPMTLTDDRGEYRIAGLGPGRYLIQVPSVQASIPAATKLPGSTGNSALDLDDSHRIIISRYPLPPPPQGGRRLAYPLIFHPSTSIVSEAEVITLKYGEDRSPIDITLRPTASVRVSGVVEGPTEAMNALTLRLLPAGLENVGIGSEAATTLVGADGRFTFFNVPAGNYLIDAPVRVGELSVGSFSGNQGGGPGSTFPMPPPAQGWNRNSDVIESGSGLTHSTTGFRGGTPAEFSARVPLTVGGADMTGVVVRLRQHATMNLRLVIEKDPKSIARFGGSLSLDPATGEAYLGRPNSRLQNKMPDEIEVATIPGIIPGSYWVRARGSVSYVVKSVIFRGRDHTTVPIDVGAGEELDVVVTITNATPELVGTVRGTNDLRADATMAVAFPIDSNQWRNTGLYPARVKRATVSSTGVYRFADLPAGEYYVVAIDRAHSAEWRDPAFLTKLARTASRVTLNWGSRASADLTPVVIR